MPAVALVVGCGEDTPISPPGLVSTEVIVSPASATLASLGDTARIAATVLDQNGQVISVAVSWASSAPTVASVDGSGLVTAVGNGGATVTARSGTAVGSAALTVEQVIAAVQVSPGSARLLAVGDTVRLTAEVVDGNGHSVAAAAIAWSSSDEAVASVDGSGLVTAVGNGGATVTARSGTAVGSAAVSVEQVIAAVHVSPDSARLLAVGDTVRLTAEVVDGNGHSVAAAAIAWSSSDEAVASVDGSGLVTAVGNGGATVTARSGTAAGGAAVSVEQVIAAVHVSPDSARLLAVGDTVRLTAEVVDGNGHSVAAAAIAWSSSDEAVASVDGSGLVTAVGNGDATVTARSGTATGSAAVSVRISQDRDRAALAAFYEAAGGTAWARNDNWLTNAPLGDWYGVRTDAVGRVVEIELNSNGLAGHLAPELGGLEGLERLALGSGFTAITVCHRPFSPPGTSSSPAHGAVRPGSANEAAGGRVRSWARRDEDGWTHGVDNDLVAAPDPTPGLAVRSRQNRLEGRIPAELGSLTSLEVLHLAGNRLSGLLPPELGGLASLEVLDLAGNRLSGLLPPELGGLASLEVLDLALNDISGPLPPELGNLANLEVLDLAKNELSGPLPAEFSGLANLRRLRLADNDLSGELRGWLGDLVNLNEIWLSLNEFTGSLPRELGNLVNLEKLILACNPLTGAIPRELGGLSSLKNLTLFGNQLSGEIPADFGRLARLEVMHLGHNYYLSGGIPPSLGSLANLEKLSLGSNQFSGPFPPELGQLANLNSLSIHYNQLTGPIPPQFADLTSLEYVSLDHNELSGPIPTELGGMANLGTLSLVGNRLTGAIPPELGRLWNLEWLTLGSNLLTGRIPPELGNLRSLEVLGLSHNNGLVGPLPLELARVPLRYFDWHSTGLCAPRTRAFQTWLAGLSSASDPSEYQYCTLIPREVFAAFYESTGGSQWVSNANWLTDAPLADWFGVTVQDSLVVALELPGNRLAGTIPPDVGDFVNLKRLDLGRNALTGGVTAALGNLEEIEVLNLSSNRLSGSVPRELGQLNALRHLDLSDNELQGALPGTLTELNALRHFDWDRSGVCAPEAAWFQAWLSSITRAGPTCGGPFVLSVPAAHLTQAAQSLGGEVPLIAGRPALARVFAAADRANDYRPDARLAFLAGGRELHAEKVSLDAVHGIPDQLDPAALDQSYHVAVPGSVLRPGVEMVVEVDPDRIMPRRDLDEVRLALDVRETPRMELTIVPIVTGSSEDEAVLAWIRRADDPPIEFMRAVLPVGDLDLTIREPFTISNLPAAEDVGDWTNLLQDIDLLRTMEAGSGYWYGVVIREGDQGVAGIAYIEGRAALGIPDPEVFAHEVGHNMSLRHAPCGRPRKLDPDFPYPDGTIGVHGYDPRSREFVDSSTPDLMSYCHPQWISDYNFNKALEYRITAEAAPAFASRGESRGRRLLLWGGVSTEGQLRLDPAFTLDAPAKLPSGTGPYRVEAFAKDGSRAFAWGFDMEEASEGGGGFLFLVPFDEERLATLERIVLSGPEGSTGVARQSPTRPMAIVVDPVTGRIRSVLRGPAAEDAIAAAAADALPGAASRDLLVSYGLPGQVPR